MSRYIDGIHQVELRSLGGESGFAFDDFVFESTLDIVVQDLEWVAGGVEFAYAVQDADLPSDTTVAFYWADGDTPNDVVDGPFYNAALESMEASYGPIFVAIGGEEIPEPPEGATHLLAFVDPPSELSDPTGTDLIDESDEDNNLFAAPIPQRHLVLVTHGRLAQASEDWPEEMQLTIAAQIEDQATTNGRSQEVQVNRLLWTEDGALEHVATRGGVSDHWDVVAFDWRNGAATDDPISAAARASWLGGRVASDLDALDYDFMHLLAHSAGSWFIDTIADTVQAETHLTFFDAYTPPRLTDVLGSSSDWAEHYVHKGNLLHTDESVPNAVNIDVTELFTGEDDVEGMNGHTWPWEWYLKTIETPDAHGWGFSQTRELGASFRDSTRGTTIILGQAGDSNNDGLFDSADLIVVFAAGKYGSGQPATRAEGDWTGDGAFDSSDLIAAFQAGTYDQPQPATAIFDADSWEDPEDPWAVDAIFALDDEDEQLAFIA